MILCGCNELPSAAVVLEEPLNFLCKKLGGKANIPTTILDKIGNFLVDGGRTEKDWLSRDTESVDSYIDDPLCGNGLKLSGLRDIIRLSNSCCTDDWAFLVPPMLPILILSGAKDPMKVQVMLLRLLCIPVTDTRFSTRMNVKRFMRIFFPGFHRTEDKIKEVIWDFRITSSS